MYLKLNVWSVLGKIPWSVLVLEHVELVFNESKFVIICSILALSRL